MLENIVVGLVSGLVVSFIVLVVGKLWSNVVEPWFEERVYKDLHIEGRWYSLYVETLDFRQEVINLKRHGHRIEGTMLCKTGEDDGETYNICGTFKNLLLPLTYEAADRKKSDRGSITLISTYNGERFNGRGAFYNTKNDEVTTTPVIWFRSKKELELTIKYIKKHKEAMAEVKRMEREANEAFEQFFEEFAEERRKQKQEENEKTIEGEATLIELKKED